MHNLIVVRTADAILICHRHQAEKIKNLSGKLPRGIAMSRLPIRRRILGVDFGRARIGVAVSDELGMLAHPRRDDSRRSATPRSGSRRLCAKKMWSAW